MKSGADQLVEEEKKELQHPGQAVEPKFGDLGLLESES